LRIPPFPFVDRWITLTLIHPTLVCRKARRARACPGHAEENESVFDEQQRRSSQGRVSEV
jgi:hypothetical protein